MSKLIEIFAAHSAAPPSVTAEEMERQLQAALDAGRQAWPDVTYAAERFIAHLASHASLSLSQMCVTDLYLAGACAAGDATALRCFDEQFLSRLGAALARIDRSSAFVDEVRQILRARLLVGADGPPKIAEYAGRGELGSWVRAAAVRTALSLIRGRKRTVAPEDADRDALLATPDPELDYIKQRYGPAFKKAFAGSLAALEAERRTLLRLHYLDGLTLAQIGKLMKVHESTISRRLETARQELLTTTRELLSEELDVAESELDSLMNLVQSRLEVSLQGALTRER